MATYANRGDMGKSYRAIGAFSSKSLVPATWTGTTFHSDLAATLLDLYGLEPSAPLEGQMVGSAPPDRVVPIWNLWSGIGADEFAVNWGGTADVYLSVVRGDLQMNYDWDGNRALYHLDTDPQGLIDVYEASDPDVVALWTSMGALVEEVRGYYPLFGDPVNPAP